MKKSILAVTLACTCACMMGLVGCGGSGNTNSANNANTNSNATAAVNTGSTSNANTNGTAATTNNSSSSSSSTSSTSTTSTTSSASTNSSSANSNAEVGTPQDAINKSTDAGVTKLSYTDMQDLMDNTLNVGMTLADVRAQMGGVDGTLMGDGYDPNTFAWYTADKKDVLIATFTGQDSTSTLTACEISVD